MLHSLEEKWFFFKQFLKKGRKIASLAPSSHALALATCKPIDPNIPQTILELGAGTGAITRVALQKMHPQSRLFAVEYDLDLASYFHKQLPKAELLVCDAQDILTQLSKHNVTKVDVILSGLPVPSLSADTNKKIFQSCHSLMENNNIPFMQITALPWVYYKMYKRLFENIKFHPVFSSFPPTGVYECHQLRSNFLTQFD